VPIGLHGDAQQESKTKVDKNEKQQAPRKGRALLAER
jgi:hypothetical protein